MQKQPLSCEPAGEQFLDYRSRETIFNLLGKNLPIKCGLGWTIHSLIKMWIHKSVGLNEDLGPSNC